MKTILLVDDSRTVRMLGKKLMTSLNFNVLEAEHGQAALEVVKSSGPIEAVLLDWNMPVMNGLEFLKALRALDLEPQPKVVMCTTENDMEHIMEAISNGANEYVMKPFTDDIIRDKFTEIGVI